MSNNSSSGTPETAEQVQEAKNNSQMWSYVQQTYTPLVDKYITKQNTDMNSGEEGKNVAGQVGAEVAKGMTKAALTSPAQNATAMNDRANTAAGIETQAQVTAAGKVKDQLLSGNQNVIDIGRGQQTGAMQDQSQLAGQSLQAAEAGKQNQLMVQGSEQSAAGAAVGIGGGLAMRGMNSPGQLYTDAGGNINNVDFGDFENAQFPKSPVPAGTTRV